MYYLKLVYGEKQTCQKKILLNNFPKCKIQKLSSLFLFLLSAGMLTNITTAHAALTAVTANTIHGTAPYLKINNTNLINLEQLLGFEMPKRDGSGGTEFIDATMAKTPILIPPSGMTFNQVVALVEADNIPHDIAKSKISDADGDAANLTNASVSGSVTVTWRNNGVVMSNAELGDNPLKNPCDNNYTLTISADSVEVKTKYGVPNSKTYGTHAGITYTIVPDTAVCYVRPNQMDTRENRGWLNVAKRAWQEGSGMPDKDNGGGYIEADFDPEHGFKPNIMLDIDKRFPTTGFPGAQFGIVMSGLQSDWKFEVVSSDKDNVTVSNKSGTEGQVTLGPAKPSGDIKITATHKKLLNVSRDYVFNPTINGWFVPQENALNWSEAKSKCKDLDNIATREELSNSPRNKAFTSWNPVVNYYTRAIGKGVFSEWGWSDQTSYPESKWAYSWYWTKDIRTISQQFIVNSFNGYVGFMENDNDKGYVACRV